MYLATNDNQFGFKKKLGTDTCIYVLKEVIDRYKTLNGSVFTCFLDASKAFDRINHRKLFVKLLARDVPGFIVRLLSFWYSNQRMCVRWGSAISDYFTVSNGVRQGGILSPYLFNVYMDDLSSLLNKFPAGCYICKILINHLMYADDLVLLCPSAYGLRLLLKLCEQFGKSEDINFNYEKSVMMIHRSKDMKDVDFGNFFINGDKIDSEPHMRYLGHYISPNLNDSRDIQRQYQYLYGQANMLTRRFHMCTEEVKIKLFRTYCTSFYTCQLWFNYTRKSMQKLMVAYNNAFRILMKYPWDCSASGMFASHALPSGQAILRKLRYKFMKRIEACENIFKAINASDLQWCSNMRRQWVNSLYSGIAI